VTPQTEHHPDGAGSAQLLLAAVHQAHQAASPTRPSGAAAPQPAAAELTQGPAGPELPPVTQLLQTLLLLLQRRPAANQQHPPRLAVALQVASLEGQAYGC
jgi:hypothetical protein